MAGRTRAVTRAEQSRIEEKTVEGLSSLGGVSLSFLKSLGFLTASFPAVSTRCVIFDSDVGKLAPPRPVSISLAADRWITEAVKGVAEASLELWKKVCESIAKEGGGSADVMDGDIQVDTVRASMEWGRNFSTQFTIADRYLEQCLSLDELFDATGGEERRFYGLMDSVLKQKLGYPFDSIPEDFCQSHWEWMRSRSDQEQQEDNPFEHGFVGSTNSVQGEKWNALSLVVEEDAAPQNERSTVRNHSPRQFGMTELLQLCAICHGDPSDLKAVGTEEPFVSDLYAALDRYLTASRQPSQEDEEDLLTMSRDSYLSKTANTDPLPRTQSSPSIPVLSKPPDILRVSVALPQENAEAESNSAHQHSSEETQILSQIAPQVSAILHQLSGPSKVWNLNQFLETTFPHGWDLRAQQAATNKKMQECARQLMNLRLYSGAESLDSVLNRTADMIEQDPITFLVHGADRKITREERNKITEICAKLRSRAEEVLSKTSALRTELLSLLGTINSRSALDLALAPEVENATQNSSYSSSCTESSRPSSPLPQQDAYDLLKDPMYGSSTYVLHSALVKRINPLQQRSRTTTIDLTESTEDTASKKSSARPAGARDIRTYMGASTTRRTTRSQANRCSVDSQEDQYLAYVRTEWGWWLRFDGKDLSAVGVYELS
ncbi:hypothetical protein BJ742DRAFT_771871 [Cladochytrium replicatum]|nr:hypothetical protein BJ742DRAFT_771871 [Cladochytrium replicatum]